MLGLKTKGEMAKDAHSLAKSFDLVRYRDVIYVPVDYENGEAGASPDPERTIWIPLDRDGVCTYGAEQFNILFANDSEAKNFMYMTLQNCKREHGTVTDLLVRTKKGLRLLGEDGKLKDPTGDFMPNTLLPVLNEDRQAKKEIKKVISEWVGGDEEFTSLMHHLATALSPGYSAVKYVLLLGGGRNGKSLLLKMVQAVFGKENTSNVTRQSIAMESPTVTDLNGKLLNLVFDGKAEYLKDSGMEKTLIAGEPAKIRLLYDSVATRVETNALFIEGLQHEPKSKDKSDALQKRLVRFKFDNVYKLDKKFEKHLLSGPMLGAFLSLLLDHYVQEDEIAEKLAPTTRTVELQLEHMFTNSVAMQYLKHLEETDLFGITGLLGKPMDSMVQPFQSWRIKENDLQTWAEPDVLALFTPVFNTERKSQRVNGVPRKVRIMVSLTDQAEAFIDSLKGDDDELDTTEDLEALVAE